MSRNHSLGRRFDVWSDVNLPRGAAAQRVARGLSSTQAHALANGLAEGGWNAELRPATLGAPPGWYRPDPPESPEQTTGDPTER